MFRHFGCIVLLAAAFGSTAERFERGWVGPAPRNARTPVIVDPVAYAIATGSLDRARWAEVVSTKDGFDVPVGAYVWTEVEAARDHAALLRAPGAGIVYVNGEPHAGDVYGTGAFAIPVRLRRGRNAFLFQSSRGYLAPKLEDLTRPYMLDARDATLPDVGPNNPRRQLGAIVVINGTDKPLVGATLVAWNGADSLRASVPLVQPLSARKVAFELGPWDRCQLKLVVGGAEAHRIELRLRRRKETDAFKSTFRSAIDGSVQYFALRPPKTRQQRAPLVLSLHGASVEAIGQAEAYGAQPRAWIAAPTNRRPFGFDWEGIGARDALEVLDQARAALRSLGVEVDDQRVYLTGHSMGGHGTWQLGAHFPDRWAAIAPSAGWCSFWSYAGGATYRDGDATGAMLRRAANASDTLQLADNFADQSVFILHGDADDNVPVAEARAMRDALAKVGADVRYHEQPGAGHWWDDSDEPGASCVDYPGIFDLFDRRIRVPEEARRVQFTTVDPGISATYGWATIVQQERSLVPSKVDLRLEPTLGRVVGTTSNVRSLRLAMKGLVRIGHIKIDGQELEAPRRRDVVDLTRTDGVWRMSRATARAGEKSPERSGTFGSIFNREVAFVYGTRGTPEENAWAFGKARYDAEQFWIRGNGAVDVVADVDAGKLAGRNILLYGAADTNSQWKRLLGASPLQVRRGEVRLGSRVWKGDDLVAFFIRPGAGACVAAISATGIAGMRAAERVPLFSAGATLPDAIVLGADYLEKGTAGVRACGFFGWDWRVESGEWAWGP